MKSRKLNSQTIETSNNPSCRTNEALEIKKDRADVHDEKINMPDYFRSSTSKVADKRAS